MGSCVPRSGGRETLRTAGGSLTARARSLNGTRPSERPAPHHRYANRGKSDERDSEKNLVRRGVARDRRLLRPGGGEPAVADGEDERLLRHHHAGRAPGDHRPRPAPSAPASGRSSRSGRARKPPDARQTQPARLPLRHPSLVAGARNFVRAVHPVLRGDPRARRGARSPALRLRPQIPRRDRLGR